MRKTLPGCEDCHTCRFMALSDAGRLYVYEYDNTLDALFGYEMPPLPSVEIGSPELDSLFAAVPTDEIDAIARLIKENHESREQKQGKHNPQIRKLVEAFRGGK